MLVDFIKSKMFYISFVLICGVGNVSAATLDEEIVYVLKNSSSIKNSIEELKLSKVELNQSKLSFLPTIDLLASQGSQEKDSFGTRGSDSEGATVGLYPYTTLVSLNQNIFNGLNDKYTIMERQHNYMYKKNMLASNINKTAYKVVDVYLNMLSAKKMMDLSAENVAMHKATQKQIMLMESNGLSNKAELSQMNNRASVSISNHIRVERDYKNALSDYVHVINRKPDNISGVGEMEINIRNLKEALKMSALNPEILAKLDQIDGSSIGYDALLSVLYPKVNVNVVKTRNRDADGLEGIVKDMTGKVTLDYNVFNGGHDVLSLQKKTIENNIIKHEKEKVARDLELDVTKSWLTNKFLFKRLVHLRGYVKDTEFTLKAYIKQFDLGQRDLLDILNSTGELYQTKVQLEQLVHEYNLNKFKIKEVTGSLINIEHAMFKSILDI